MKITTTAEAFVAALKNSRTKKKSTIPVLSQVLVEDNRLISTDLDMTVIVPFEGKGKGRFLIPHRAVLDVLTGEKGSLIIEAIIPKPAKNSKETVTPSVKLSINGCEYKFDMMNLTNFPQIPKPVATTLTVDSKEFRKLLDRTMFAVSRQESRYILNWALLKALSGQKVVMIATDGHRLAYAEGHSSEGELSDTLIRSTTLEYLKSRVSGSIAIGKSDDHVTFCTNGITVIARTMSGKFPNWEAVMPKNQPIHTTVASGAKLAAILARVAKCADERSHAVKFTFGDVLTISAQSSERGSAKGIYPCAADGTVTLGLCSDYILEFLKMAGDVPVEIGLEAADKPASFKLDGWDYIVMPMRL